MDENLLRRTAATLEEIRQNGLFKVERMITSPQGAEIQVNGRTVLNFCANNYLGLSSHPRLVAAAHEGIDRYGFGMSSVRFICGTQDQHRRLEKELASFVGMEDSILYTSCFDANGGVFETLLGPEDAIISDALNHASIIDGIRLCKAKRLRYSNCNMAELENCLKEAADARVKLNVTDGVFSMDGTVAPLGEICDLADRYGAAVMVDDSHATGFFGKTGRGTVEHHGVMGRVDIITSTLGKALGGASGGFTAGSAEIVELLRQRSRPYLFSNSVPPALVAASLACLDLLRETTVLRDRLERSTTRFRKGMTAVGFTIKPGIHPIVPVMLHDARLASTFAEAMLGEGIYVIGFSYPVVPIGQARIRVQISAAHEDAHIDRALQAFEVVGKRLGVLASASHGK
ncbi:MAG TPA: glycine C-acetyltransferase [Planctomycetota bacterium]|nr:glycine C-acetyltransferase [Planctomycetota bacterium]